MAEELEDAAARQEKALEEQRRRAESHTAQLQQRLMVHEGELTDARNAVAVLQSEKEAADQQIAALAEELEAVAARQEKALEEQGLRAESHAAELRQRLMVREGELADTRNATAVLQSEKEAANQQIAALAEELEAVAAHQEKALEEQGRRAESHATQLQQRLMVREGELADARNAAAVLHSEKEAGNQQIANLANQGQALAEDQETLGSELAAEHAAAAFWLCKKLASSESARFQFLREFATVPTLCLRATPHAQKNQKRTWFWLATLVLHPKTIFALCYVWFAVVLGRLCYVWFVVVLGRQIDGKIPFGSKNRSNFFRPPELPQKRDQHIIDFEWN